jgi:hypothetical protein
VAGQWFFPGTPVSSTNKIDCQNIAEILLKVALNTIAPACPFTLCRGFFTPKIVGTFYMQGYKVKEKTAIVPHCTPSFKTQWAPWALTLCIIFIRLYMSRKYTCYTWFWWQYIVYLHFDELSPKMFCWCSQFYKHLRIWAKRLQFDGSQ